MNHDTGKSRKLNDEDMTEMQSLASDILMMERGQSKAVTAREHLERNDFIIEKQKEEMKRLDATRQYREYQLEMANQKMQETESITNALIEKANEKERQSEDLDRAISEKRSKLNREKGSELLNAAVGWATGKSKALRNEIEDLRNEISTHEETIERLQDKIQTIQSDHHRELMKLESRHQSELSRKEAEHTQETTRLKTGLHGKAISSTASVSCCSKQTTSSARLFTVSSVLPVIITSPVLIRNRCRTSRVPLTCSGRTDNHSGLPEISCISPPSKRAGLTIGNKSKPDGKLTMWWKGIMTNSRKEVFR